MPLRGAALGRDAQERHQVVDGGDPVTDVAVGHVRRSDQHVEQREQAASLGVPAGGEGGAQRGDGHVGGGAANRVFEVGEERVDPGQRGGRDVAAGACDGRELVGQRLARGRDLVEGVGRRAGREHAPRLLQTTEPIDPRGDVVVVVGFGVHGLDRSRGDAGRQKMLWLATQEPSTSGVSAATGQPSPPATRAFVPSGLA